MATLPTGQLGTPPSTPTNSPRPSLPGGDRQGGTLPNVTPDNPRKPAPEDWDNFPREAQTIFEYLREFGPAGAKRIADQIALWRSK